MAVLTDAERKELWAQFQRNKSLKRELFGNLTKAEIRAMVDAADNWVDSNSASYNSALPLPGRTESSAKDKAELLVLIVKKRWEVT